MTDSTLKSNTKGTRSDALTDRFGLLVPSALPLLDDEEVMLLRVLGRLEMMTVAQIQQLIFPTLTLRGVQKHLDRLLGDGLIWRAQSRTVAVNHAAQHEKVPRRGAFVYGLSDDAKALLETLDVEHDPLTRARLVSRDPRGRKPDTRTMAHDLQVSWFCTNALLSAARNRYCRQIYVQTEFYPEKRQRIDALIMLRLNPDHPRPASEVGRIPFFDGTPRQSGQIDVRLALEIDRGSEELKVLLEKIEKYRDLTQLGVYDQTIGGPLLVVFIVQTPRRAGQLARQFQDIWPSGWGVVSTPQSANHLQDGCCGAAIRAWQPVRRLICSASWWRTPPVRCSAFRPSAAKTGSSMRSCRTCGHRLSRSAPVAWAGWQARSRDGSEKSHRHHRPGSQHGASGGASFFVSFARALRGSNAVQHWFRCASHALPGG